jgi:hypothetical protein
VGIEEVTRTCLPGWYGKCGLMRLRLDGARGWQCGCGRSVLAQCFTCRLQMVAQTFCAVRHLIVSLISVTVAAKAATAARLPSADFRGFSSVDRSCRRKNFSDDPLKISVKMGFQVIHPGWMGPSQTSLQTNFAKGYLE